jgi:hypothetical protein
VLFAATYALSLTVAAQQYNRKNFHSAAFIPIIILLPCGYYFTCLAVSESFCEAFFLFPTPRFSVSFRVYPQAAKLANVGAKNPQVLGNARLVDVEYFSICCPAFVGLERAVAFLLQMVQKRHNPR